MNTQKNKSYQEIIRDRISTLKAEIDGLESDLKVVNQLDKKLGLSAIPILKKDSSDTNLDILKNLIKEGEQKTPPVSYSSGQLIEGFSKIKNCSVDEVSAIVYNVLSTAAKQNKLIKENGKWKTPQQT